MRLIKPRSIARITNDTYFEHTNGLILNRAALFENLADMHHSGYSFAFPNMRVAYFINCDKNYTWYNVEPERMPNLRHICLATRYDSEIVYRFPKKTNVWYHISRKHFRSNIGASTASNVVIWDHDTLVNFIDRLKTQPLQVLTTDRMRRD
jgi:hypothetical protein